MFQDYQDMKAEYGKNENCAASVNIYPGVMYFCSLWSFMLIINLNVFYFLSSVILS